MEGVKAMAQTAAQRRWRKVRLVIHCVADFKEYLKNKKQDKDFVVFLKDTYVWVRLAG